MTKLPPGVKARLITGLEIHVQLHTKTKMFCSCPVRFGAPPNSLTCPVCMGLPGALPSVNREAVAKGITAGIALNCRIARITRWDRKNYSYPDLPKNYQITQYRSPLAENGYIDIPISKPGAEKRHAHSGGQAPRLKADKSAGGGSLNTSGGAVKRIRIKRIHLEEDAGKSFHQGSGYAKVDLNRAGTPLLEIVTEPDLSEVKQAGSLARELHRTVRHLGISHADMQKGHMRFEPNINCEIQTHGTKVRTPVVEIKNLNSFRALEAAVRFEFERQINEYLKNPDYTLESAGKQNRGWDDRKLKTLKQRYKEEAHEYMYFPEPDLVPVEIADSEISRLRKCTPELPLHKQRRISREAGVSEEDAHTIIQDPQTAELFEEALRNTGFGKTLAKHFLSFWLKHANEMQTTVAGLRVEAERMAELAQMAGSGEISATSARQIASAMVNEPDPPSAIAKRLQLYSISDRDKIRGFVQKAISSNPKAVSDYKKGGKKHKKAFGFLTGQVMRFSRGRANPKLTEELLREELGK